MHVRYAMAAAAIIGLSAGFALSADQTVLGKSFTAKNPSTPDRRKVTVVGKEIGSPNTLVGDPVSNGATVTINANGTNPSTQTFVLNAGVSSTGKPFWKASGTGFKYKDAKGDQSAVKSVSIKLSPSGSFLIKIKVAGKLDGGTVIVPPNTGTDACAVLSINGGDAYSIAFGPESEIKNSADKLFKAKRPQLEGVCAGAPVTTTSTSTSSSTSTSTTPTTAPPTTSTSTSTSTTTTTLYGSPSRAFVDRVSSLLE